MGRIVKKTIELNQDYIDRARVIFGVRTDKAAVNKALELAVIDDEIIKCLIFHKPEILQGSFLPMQEPSPKMAITSWRLTAA